MYSLSYRILQNSTAAEEAVQESFIKVWKHAKEWKKELSAFSTWLYRITSNTCIDLRRKAIRQGEQMLSENLASDFDDKQIEREEMVKFVERLMLELSPQQQMCLNLFYKEELKQTEIAKVMNISVKAVEGNLLRGKRKLLEILNKKGIKLDDFAL